jgi:dihydrofolate reductase
MDPVFRPEPDEVCLQHDRAPSLRLCRSLAHPSSEISLRGGWSFAASATVETDRRGCGRLARVSRILIERTTDQELIMPTDRTLVVTENMTVDGVIDAADGWFSPAGAEAGIDSADIEAIVREHVAAQDALLLGRVTFESFREYWPKHTDDTTGITAHLNEVRKYVLSSTLDDPRWENTTVLHGDLAAEVQALKEQPGREIGVTGSISVVWKLIEAGLVDEYRLFVYPTIIGHGRRLFESATTRPRLQLAEARPFRSGVVLLTYGAACPREI